MGNQTQEYRYYNEKTKSYEEFVPEGYKPNGEVCKNIGATTGKVGEIMENATITAAWTFGTGGFGSSIGLGRVGFGFVAKGALRRGLADMAYQYGGGLISTNGSFNKAIDEINFTSTFMSSLLPGRSLTGVLRANLVANNPIYFIDPDGKVIRIHYMEGGKSKYYTYKPGIKPTTSNAFVQQVHQAVTAVMKNDANKTFQNISNSKETVTFNQISTNDDATKGTMSDTKVSNVSIDWNPTTGMKTTIGGAINPATALLHEAGHAERYINTDTKAEVDALKTDLKPNGTTYDNNEEKRVVDNIETPYINKTNSNQLFDLYNTSQQEGTRTDHRGTTYTTTGVNSIAPADGTTVTGQSFGKIPPAAIDNTRVVKPIIIPLKKP